MDDNRFKQAQLIASYKRALLGSPFGREVILDICSINFVDRPTVTADSHMTYFNEGRRAAALDILSKLNIDVRQFLLEGTTLEDV